MFQRFFSSLPNKRRRIEIRLADTEAMSLVPTATE